MALHLVADDLTGTLDTAAQFCGALGPIAVLPRVPAPGGATAPGPLALNLASRERARDEAIAAAERSAPFLMQGLPAFKKIDSLLRGHWAAELAAAMRSGFASCVLAPAFPAQGRITVGGRQLRLAADGAVVEAGPPLRDSLLREGVHVADGPGGMPPDGATVHVYDARTQEDLARAVMLGTALPGPVLWCGSAGLAAALARQAPPRALAAPLAAPVLVLVGTDHDVTRGQIDAVRRERPDAVVTLGIDSEANLAATSAALAAGLAVATFDIAVGTSRPAAARIVAHAFGSLLPRLPPPTHLVVAGGETLMSVCDILGVESLTVHGEFGPGIPVSRMTGGLWDGTVVVSKSGAFGEAHLLASMLFG